MNYKNIYSDFIQDRLLKQDFKGYAENHHIIPKSLGGEDDNSNMIRLTAKDHFFAHRLLAKIYGGKMVFAFSMMLKTRGDKLATRHTYEALRIEVSRELSKLHKGVLATDEHRAKISEAHKGKKHTDEHRANNSKGQLGKKLSQSHKDAISKGGKGLKKPKGFGDKIAEINRHRVFTDEHRANISNALKGHKLSEETRQRMRDAVRPKITHKQRECPHCGTIGAGGNMTRYHFANCKVRQIKAS